VLSVLSLLAIVLSVLSLLTIVLSVLSLLTIVLSVLRFTACDYTFRIFKYLYVTLRHMPTNNILPKMSNSHS
jgi:hypothetical protein